jgi:enoyl-CoA hydratase
MPLSDIHFEQIAAAGLITLDRPEALNALSIKMLTALHEQFMYWADDPSVTHVILCSSSPRAFCAGGDIKYARQLALSDFSDEAVFGAAPYFRAEYSADIALIKFDKPVIALCDGIVMGGGAGLAQHSQHIVMTENTRFAMPETVIGLFPDVGASLFLGRCPMPVARLLGMHGYRLEAADCLLLGLATAQVPSTSLAALKEKLLACDVADIGSVIQQFQTDAGQPLIAAQRRLIDHIFASGSVESMRDRAVNLAENMPENKFLGEVVAGFATRCPFSIKVFDRLLAETANVTDPMAAIELDFHLALRMTKRVDFVEGVRSIVIDKDQAPQWTPNSLEAVTETMLDAVFNRAGLPPFL